MTTPRNLLKIQDGDMPTTINTLVNSSCFLLTYIVIQVLYNSLQNNLSTCKHPYLIYCIWPSLRILKFGYPASNITINSSMSFCALNLCVTPFSSQSITINGPIIIFDHSVGTMKNIMNGYIDKFLPSTLVLGHNTNIMQTNQHTSPG